MRIAHISDCYLPRTGGIELQVRGLTQAQQAAGDEPVIITATPAHETSDPGEPEFDNGVPVRRLAIRLPGELPVTPHVGSRLRVELADVDVVHVHGGLLSPFAWPALRTAVHAGLPAVVSVHSVWANWSRGFALADLLWHWREWPVVWTGVSELAKSGIVEAIGTGHDVRVLNNGIDVAKWRIDREGGRSRNHVNIVSVARLAMRKRAMALIDMLAAARDLTPPSVSISATLIGDGPDRRRLQRAIDRRDLGWITLPGLKNHDEIRGTYATSDIYVSPSKLESFGIAALEARTAGLPLIARADSGVTEFLTDGVEGLLARDDAGMVHAIRDLCTDSDRRMHIADHNSAVPPPFDWPNIIEQASAIYADAISLRTNS